MKDIALLVLEHTLEKEHGCSTFTDGTLIRNSYEYRLAAETKINAMSNFELLCAVEEALEWKAEGGDIGL